MFMLLNIAIITTIMTACILLIKTIFKHKMSAKAHYYIWTLLIVRLIFISIMPSFDIESARMENNYNEQELEQVLIHELYHLKNKDTLTSYTFEKYPLIQSSFEVGLLKTDNSGEIKGDTIVSMDKDGKTVQNKAVVSEEVYGLVETIEYSPQNKNMSFALPEKLPEGYKWENGKTYNYEFKENPMISTSFDIGLMNIKTQEIENEITVVLNSDGTLTY